jgi:hypothetical protein
MKFLIMTEEPDYFNEEETKPSTGTTLNKAIAIMFVGGIYLIIFLKILFIK